MAFKLAVEGFSDGANIPRRFTCDGQNVSPALRWANEPSGARSFALILEDPDAPGGTFNHWLLWNVSANVHSLSEGETSVGVPGQNDFGKLGYGGPCPPKGRGPHRYFFRLFAVDTPELDLKSGANRAVLEQSLRKHGIAEARYTGRYERR